MCAAEIGLRALAKDRRVEVQNPRTGKPIALQYAQWGEMLKPMAKKVLEIQQWKAGPIRDAAQQFYSSLVIEANGVHPV